MFNQLENPANASH